jgi:hypothetical protein
MNLQEIIETLELQVLTTPKEFDQITPASGYSADLLSCVMSGAKHQSIWVTLQCHNNIVAVAALLDLTAIIITEGAQPEPDTITKANEENVTLLSTSKRTYEICGRLWQMGLRE